MTQISTASVAPDKDVSRSNSIRIVTLAGVIGNVIEWYDFALYGYFAPVISALFFPNDSELISLLQTYGVFAAGFIMRPIGAGVFGYIGDRMGRRVELFLSVVLMAVPTFLLGALPDYDQIGIAAPIALVVLRLVQGLSVGGEFTGSVTYVAETAPQDRRGFATSFANVGSMVGILLGLGIVTLMTYFLPDASLHRWGWRLPFLLGGGLGLIGFYIRRNIPVSEVFEAHQEKRPAESPAESPAPLVGSLRQSLVPMLQVLVYAGGYSTVFYITLVYVPTYLGQFTEIALSQALLINTVAIAIQLPIIPAMGWLSDVTLRRKTWLLMAILAMALWAIPAFWLFHQSNLLWVWLAQIGLAVLMGPLLAISPAMMVELFPTETRLTAYSLSFNLGVSIVGGTSLLVCTWLIKVSGNVGAPAVYLTGSALIAAAGLAFMGDRSREPLL